MKDRPDLERFAVAAAYASKDGLFVADHAACMTDLLEVRMWRDEIRGGWVLDARMSDQPTFAQVAMESVGEKVRKHDAMIRAQGFDPDKFGVSERS